MNPFWFFKLLGIRLRQFREAYKHNRQRLPRVAQLRKWAFYGGLAGLGFCLLRTGGYGWLGFIPWGAGIGAASLPAIRALKKIPPVGGHWIQAALILLVTRIIVAITSPYFSILYVLRHLL